MNHKNVKKISFGLALTMIVGTVVGIGIFFKNISIKKTVDSEGIAWLLTWVISGIIAICCALSYWEIGTLKNSKISGLANWSTQIKNKKFGYFITFNWTFFYGGLLICIISFFSAETFLELIKSIFNVNVPIYVLPFCALSIFAIIFLTLMLSIKNSKWIQSITTVIKLLPLLFAIIVGIIFANKNFSGGSNTFLKPFTAKGLRGMFVSLPAALFAYDAFLSVGSVGSNMEHSEKKIPLAILFGMLSIVIIYCLIALSAILHNSGSVEEILKNTLDINSKQKAIKASLILFNIFLFISTFGVLNGFVATFSYDINNVYNANLMINSKKLKEKYNLKQLIAFTVPLIYLVIWIIISTIVFIIKSDYLLDGLSNLPTMIFFNFYGLIICFYLQKRKTFATKKMNSVLYWIISIFAIIGSIGANVIYLTQLSLEIYHNETLKWGLFFVNNKTGPKYIEMLFYFGYWTLILISPYLNKWIIKKAEKRNVEDGLDDLFLENNTDPNKFELLVYNNYKIFNKNKLKD